MNKLFKLDNGISGFFWAVVPTLALVLSGHVFKALESHESLVMKAEQRVASWSRSVKINCDMGGEWYDAEMCDLDREFLKRARATLGRINRGGRE